MALVFALVTPGNGLADAAAFRTSGQKLAATTKTMFPMMSAAGEIVTGGVLLSNSARSLFFNPKNRLGLTLLTKGFLDAAVNVENIINIWKKGEAPKAYTFTGRLAHGLQTSRGKSREEAARTAGWVDVIDGVASTVAVLGTHIGIDNARRAYPVSHPSVASSARSKLLPYANKASSLSGVGLNGFLYWDLLDGPFKTSRSSQSGQ